MVGKLGLYIHIPFCKSKCSYCDFYSIKSSKDKINKYCDSLKQEIEFYSLQYKSRYIIDSIYIGGGTPSILNPDQLNDLLDHIKNSFLISDNCEYTVEVNPESVSLGHLNLFKKVGIDRISLGVQTFNNKILKILNRIADRTEIIKKISLIIEYGFKNLSLDLIFGLPYQDMEKFKEDLKTVISFNPAHLSLYSLIIDKSTPIYNIYLKDKSLFGDDDINSEFYIYANKFLLKNKYKRYEVSNFALKEYQCKHNLKYWNGHPYLGLGASSVSTINNLRWKNVPDVDKYIALCESELLNERDVERITKKKKYNEKIMLGLRLSKGIDIKNLDEYEKRVLSSKKSIINDFKKMNLLKKDNKRIYLSLKGVLFSNSIISELMID